MPFSDEAWNSPESDLEADQFCSVCLVDLNAPGETKVKTKCKLPVRNTPGGPYNKAALRNAAARIFQMSGVPPSEKKAAARKLVRLMREAQIETGDSILRLAGMG